VVSRTGTNLFFTDLDDDAQGAQLQVGGCLGSGCFFRGDQKFRTDARNEVRSAVSSGEFTTTPRIPTFVSEMYYG
jgi:hypothetical protein